MGAVLAFACSALGQQLAAAANRTDLIPAVRPTGPVPFTDSRGREVQHECLTPGCLHLEPRLTALGSVLEAKMWSTAFNVCFQFRLASLHHGSVQGPRPAVPVSPGRAVRVAGFKTRVESKAPMVSALETKISFSAF